MKRTYLVTITVVAILVLILTAYLVFAPNHDLPKIMSSFGKTSTDSTNFDYQYLSVPAVAELYEYDGREIAKRITSSGAFQGNADGGKGYNLESQGDAFKTVAAGVIATSSDKGKLLDTGIKAFEWGFAQEAADGSFPLERADDTKAPKYQNIHPISFFLEPAARAILLLQSAPVDAQYADRAQALIPKLHTAAQYIDNPANLADFEKNSVDTNQLTAIAAVLQLTGTLTNDTKLIADGRSAMQVVLSRQLPDGTFPEKKGFDSGYQFVSLDYISQYSTTVTDPAWKQTVLAAIAKGYAKERTAIRANGTLDTSHNTRTGACGASVPGTGPKGHAIDIFPIRLYYYGVLTNQLSTYAPIAQSVLTAGQNFDHVDTCKSDGDSPD